MRILIADNAEEIVKLLQELLSTQGHTVDIAFDGKTALELLGIHHYDMGFFDHDMPEITGLELTKHIRQNKLETVVVIISGYPAMEDFFVKTLGADEFMPKPFRLEDIVNLTHKYGKNGQK